MQSFAPKKNHTRTLIAVLLSTMVIATGCGQRKLDNVADQGNNSTASSGKKLSRLMIQYESVAEVLQLGDDEDAAIQAVHNKHQQLLDEWNADSGSELRDIQSKALKAARNKDLAALRAMDASGEKQKVAELVAEKRTMKRAYEAALLLSIPADKQNQWKTHLISSSFLDFFEPLNLSDDQIEKIKNYAAIATSQVNREPNWQALATVKLENLFANDVAEEQTDSYAKLRKRNALRHLGNL